MVSDISGSIPGKEQSLVSVIIVAYKAGEYLPTCLMALRQQVYSPLEILVVDTTPHDPATARVLANFPEARLIEVDKNLGYAGGNNLGFAHARGRYVAVLNPDTEPDPGWLAMLVAALEADPRAGLATSKILLFHQRDTINTCGNDVHYTGLAMCRGLGCPADDFSRIEPVAAVSGAAFLIRQDVFARLGGFDERFFMYVEDTDLSWRAALLGFDCLYVPASVVYHHYVTRVSATKFFYLERNRYLMLLKSFRLGTLLSLLPALLLTEIVTWGFAIMRGLDYVQAKVGAYRWIASHPRMISAARQRVQKTRAIPDGVLLKRLSYRIDFGQVSSGWLATLAHGVFEVPYLAWQRVLLAVDGSGR